MECVRGGPSPEAMRAAGKARGGTYENAVVVEGDRILSPGGLRHADVVPEARVAAHLLARAQQRRWLL